MNTSDDRRPVADTSHGSDPRRVIQVEPLLGGSNELKIVHGDVIYRLRVTRSGKLILNK